MNKLTILLGILLTSCSHSQAYTYDADMLNVIDGDTFNVVDMYGWEHKVRLAYIDAPELKQEYGKEAAGGIDLCLYKPLKVDVKSYDLYGRQIAEVFCDGESIGLNQVSHGNAWVYDKYIDNAHKLEYFKAQDDAKENKFGLWHSPHPIKPCKFRGKC